MLTKDNSMRKLLIPALLLTAVACNTANFGSGGAKRSGAVLPTNGQTNLPLNVSEFGSNDDLAKHGPKA